MQTHVASPTVPLGVDLRPLTMHHDQRGAFTEIFREEWRIGVAPVQWNCVRSAAGVLRGVHAHATHADYLIVVHGRASIGLRDLRRNSPTAGVATLVELHGDRLTGITIPPGVAHGFYFHEPSLHIYAVSKYWDPNDELGCHWADPALGIPWPINSAQVSPRDAALPSLSALVRELAI